MRDVVVPDRHPAVLAQGTSRQFGTNRFRIFFATVLFQIPCTRGLLPMNVIDAVFLAFFGLFMILGLFRGVVSEVVSLLSWVGGGVLAVVYGPQLGDAMAPAIQNPLLRTGAGTIAIFFGVLLLGLVLGFVFKKLVRAAGLGILDRLLGMGFGVVRAGLIVSVIVLVVSMTPFTNNSMWQGSEIASAMSPYADDLRGFVPDHLGAYIHSFHLPGVPT